MVASCARRCLLALASLFTLSSAAYAQSPYSDLFVFGDSLTDPGNAFIATSNLPFVPQVPGPAYFKGRFSNGYNFADDLSLHLFGHVTDPAFGGGHNFAVGGATTGTQNRAAPVPSGMRVQTDTFVRSLGTGNADPNALYLVYGGSNDIFDATSDLSPQNPGDINGLVSGAMGNLAEIIGDLSSHGARHFLIPNIADLGKVPSLLNAGATSSFATQASTAFNHALDALLDGYTDLDIHRLDVHAAFDAARQGKFG